MNEMAKSSIEDTLKKGRCSIRYKKDDGAYRIAEGTLDSKSIPHMTSGKKKVDAETVMYYDLNVEAWRSFKVKNLIQIDLTGIIL